MSLNGHLAWPSHSRREQEHTNLYTTTTARSNAPRTSCAAFSLFKSSERTFRMKGVDVKFGCGSWVTKAIHNTRTYGDTGGSDRMRSGSSGSLSVSVGCFAPRVFSRTRMDSEGRSPTKAPKRPNWLFFGSVVTGRVEETYSC